MFGKLFKKKKEIKLLCFDLDNTLEDYGSAESETEVYIAKLISKDFHNKKSPNEILKVFNSIKHHHMHHDIDPRNFSRGLWIKETLLQLKLNKLNKLDKLSKLDKLDNTVSHAEKNTKTQEKTPEYYEAIYWDYIIPGIRLFPDVESTLKQLKKSRYKLALLTDSDGKKEIKINRINALGISQYFDYVITTDDTGVNKPDIKNWEYILKISGFSADQCIMIGDHPDTDLLTPKKLGFITVWTKEHLNADSHYVFVDYEIRSITEIIGILKKL